MSPLGWFVLMLAVEVMIVGLAIKIARQETQKFGCYADRMTDAAIQLRACVAWLQDWQDEQRRVLPHVDHPVNPPDSLPDEGQEEVA